MVLEVEEQQVGVYVITTNTVTDGYPISVDTSQRGCQDGCIDCLSTRTHVRLKPVYNRSGEVVHKPSGSGHGS